MKNSKTFMAVLALSVTVVLQGCTPQTPQDPQTSQESSQETSQETSQNGSASEKISYEDYLDHIQLGQYKGLEVERMSTLVTDEDVEESFVSAFSVYDNYEEITDRDDVREGDIANIDFLGKVDGVAFDGGAAEGYYLKIGSGTLIPGFEEQLVGMKVGDSKVIEVTFPEDYGAKELAGKDATFDVTINSINKEGNPEIDDEAIAEYTGGKYKSVDDYKAYLRAEMQKNAIEYADSAMYIELWQMAVDNSEIKGEIPKELITEKKERIQRNALLAAEGYGVTMEEFLSQIMGTTEEDFEKDAEDFAIQAAKESLVLAAIAKEEGIEVSDEDLQEGIEEYVKLYNYPSEEEFKKSVDLDEFREYILETRVQEFLADNAIITEAEPRTEPEEEETAEGKGAEKSTAAGNTVEGNSTEEAVTEGGDKAVTEEVKDKK